MVIDPDLYDLNRVEILRGPQGTLYGSGSMGGTIKLVTNRPVLNEFQASAQATDPDTHTGGGNGAGSMMLNIPLGRMWPPFVWSGPINGTRAGSIGWYWTLFPLETASGARGTCWERRSATCRPCQLGTPGRWSGEPAPSVDDRLTIVPAVLYQKIEQGGPNTIDNPPGPKMHTISLSTSPNPSRTASLLYRIDHLRLRRRATEFRYCALVSHRVSGSGYFRIPAGTFRAAGLLFGRRGRRWWAHHRDGQQ